MKIAQIAPLIESVPPRLYGGTERIVSYLTDELVRLGHEVTLFASGDSVSRANLVSCAPMALRLDSNVRDPIPYYMLQLDRVRRHADEFDILYFHIDQFHFPLFRDMADRTITTLHGRQDLPDLKALYVGFSDMPLVSISNAQREPIANANFVATIYHGLPRNLHVPTYQPRGGYVAFIGRISPEKGPDRAIRLARTLGAFAQRAWGGIHWRNQRAPKDQVSRRRSGSPIPNRLAGAVRPIFDRIDGLWDACAGVRSRLRT
jgi:glycosyltransferase involved in cell wall biosynthesis